MFLTIDMKKIAKETEILSDLYNLHQVNGFLQLKLLEESSFGWFLISILLLTISISSIKAYYLIDEYFKLIV